MWWYINMGDFYKYELWNGKEVVGYYNTSHGVYGKVLIIPCISEFKRKYSTSIKEIQVPVISRVVYTTPTECLTRIVLDVRKKSKRQIEIIKNSSLLF